MKLRSNCKSRGCGVSDSEFEDVMHLFNSIFVFSDGPEAKGLLISAWNKNNAAQVNWAYESGLRGSGLGKWVKFCKFITSNSLLQTNTNSSSSRVKVAKTSATLGKNGVTVVRAGFKLQGGEVESAHACTPWLELDLDLKLGHAEGRSKAVGKFLQISQLQVDGKPVYAFHRDRKPVRAEVGIPILYEPRPNHTHFEGEPKVRKGVLIMDLKLKKDTNGTNQTWVLYKKHALLAKRNPVDTGPESEKHLVLEEVDFEQGGKVHFATNWKPKNCAATLEVDEEEDLSPGSEDFKSSELVFDFSKNLVKDHITIISESLPDISVAYKMSDGKTVEIALQSAVA